MALLWSLMFKYMRSAKSREAIPEKITKQFLKNSRQFVFSIPRANHKKSSALVQRNAHHSKKIDERASWTILCDF